MADGEGGGRAVKVESYSTFLRIFFDGVTFDGDLTLNDSISAHFSNWVMFNNDLYDFFENFENLRFGDLFHPFWKRDEPQTGSDDPWSSI